MVNASVNLLSILVTYNPIVSDLKDIVNRLVESGASVFISDNGSNNINDIKSGLVNYESNRVIINENSYNIGLASAQNVGIRFAITHKFKYICFFDQDTKVPKKFAEAMIEEYKNAEIKFPEIKIGMIAPNYYDFRTNEFAHFAKLTNHGYIDKKFDNEQFLNVSFVISSGSMVKVETIKHVGLLKDEYFIDQVDTEFSLRLLSCGYSILVTSNVLLKHTIGNRTKNKFLGLTIKPNNHSAKRKYFIFRNGVNAVNQYKKIFPGVKYLMLKRFIHDFLGVILYENNKIIKIKAMLNGFQDGEKNSKQWDNKIKF